MSAIYDLKVWWGAVMTTAVINITSIHQTWNDIIHIKWYKTLVRLLNHSSGISLEHPCDLSHAMHGHACWWHRFWHLLLQLHPVCPSSAEFLQMKSFQRLHVKPFWTQHWGVFRGEFFYPKRKRQFRGSMDDWLNLNDTTMYLFESPFRNFRFGNFRFTLLCISNRYQLAKYLTKCNILLFQIHLMS